MFTHSLNDDFEIKNELKKLLVLPNSHDFGTRTRTRTMSLFYEGF